MKLCPVVESNTFETLSLSDGKFLQNADRSWLHYHRARR